MEEEFKWLEDKKVDFPDLAAWLILKWKPIFLCGLIGLIFAVVVFILVPAKKAEKEAASPEQTVAAARKSLSGSEALEVDNAFNDYKIYQNYNKELGRFSSVFLDTEKNDGKIMIAKYYIVSRLKYCSSFYTDIAISSEDYDKIYEIAYPNADKEEDFTAKKVCPVQFISERDGNTDLEAADDKATPSLSETILITAYIKADTEEQCKGILDVINSSFEKETQQLKKTDGRISCSCADAGYISDQKNFYDNAEKMVVERLSLVNNALNTLDNNYINKYSDKQKKYYNSLKAAYILNNQDEGNAGSADSADYSDEKKTGLSIELKSFLKFAGLGFLVGFVLAADIVILIYVLDGRVKTYKELGEYGIQTLDTSYFEKGNNPILRIARLVRRISPTKIDEQLPMLAEDITITLKNAGVDKLYILLTDHDEKDMQVAGRMKDMLEENGFMVITGNPLESIEELKKLSEMDRVIILAHMKRTRKSNLIKAGAICQRFSKEVYGFIAIDEC